MAKHTDYVTHINNIEDVVYLKTPTFPVNMRLFETSPEYKNIILQCCAYIQERCLNETEGYKKPHGMSGANLAIPFNIIGVVINRNQYNEYCHLMINPVITNYGKNNEVITRSNCGSLTLLEPINVTRHYDIVVEWYDKDGKFHNERVTRHEAGFSIQHEVDHNNGILITDRAVDK